MLNPYGGSRRGLDAFSPWVQNGQRRNASRFLRISKSVSRKNAEIQVGGDPIDRELATDFLSSQRNPWPAINKVGSVK
jgi:hypothetical protein